MATKEFLEVGALDGTIDLYNKLRLGAQATVDALAPAADVADDVLALAGLERRFISPTSSLPPVPTPTELAALPTGVQAGGAYYPDGTGFQRLLWNAAQNRWDPAGPSLASNADLTNQAVAPTVTFATRAALSAWARQSQFAFAEGHRWTWAASGTSNGSTVLTATGGGVWRMESPIVADPDTLATTVPNFVGELATAGQQQYTSKLLGVSATVNLSQGNTQNVDNFLASYFVTGTGFTPDLVGQRMVGPGVAAGCTVIRVNSPTLIWVDRPTGASGSSVAVTFRPQRYGASVIPTPDGLTAYQPTETGSNRERLYAWDFGFKPGNTAAQNKAAFIKCQNYGLMMRIYEIVLPSGISKCGDNIQVSSNMSVLGSGKCFVDPQDNTGAVFIVGETFPVTFDMLDNQFTQVVTSRIEGIVFRSFGARAGAGLRLGNQGGSNATAGTGFRIKRCGFQNLDVGMYLDNNVWCVDFQDCWWEDNNIHYLPEGDHNTGENITFTNNTFSGAVTCVARLNGAGGGFIHVNCSFDYNFQGFIYNGSGYEIRLIGGWIEYSSSGEFLKRDAGIYDSFTADSALIVRNGASAGQFALASMASIPVSLPHCTYWQTIDGIRHDLLQGSIEVFIGAAATSNTCTLPYVCELAPPHVIAMGNPGGAWWITAPSASAVNGTDMQTLTINLAAPAPAGGVKFRVMY